MREIRFRVVVNNKCIGEEFLDPIFAGWRHLDYSDLSEDGSPWVRGGTMITDHGALRLQYTDLKDKNGREVYEGNVVATLDMGNKTIEWGGPWKIAAFGLTGKRLGKRFPNDPDYTWDALNPETARTIEVLGNIYENPELVW